MLVEPAVLVIHLHVYANAPGGKLARLGGSRPVAITAWLICLVYIVCVAENAQAGVVGEAEVEGAGQPAVACSAGKLGIANQTCLIVALQRHIHHIVFLQGAGMFLLVLFLVELQFLNHIIGQVVEHDAVVTSEEFLSVEQQVVHPPAVHQNFPARLQLAAGNAANESAEHGAFRNVESISIHLYGIPLVGYLNY